MTQGPGDGSPHRGAGEDEVPVEGAGRAPGGAEEEREPGGEGGGIIEPPPVDGLNTPGIERLIATIIAQAMAHGGATGGGTGGGPGGPQGGNRPDDIEGLNYNEVDKALIVCGVGDPAMRDIIRVAEAFETLESFCLLEDDEAVDAWLKRASQKPAPNQLSLGEVQIYNLKGLAYWVRDRMARGLPLTADEFDVDAMREAIEMRRLEKKRNKEEDIKEPGKCETGTGWDEWKESFINYCSQKRSAAGGPLSYVIREDVNPRTYAFRDEQERKLHQYPHRGNVYMTDNRRVAQLLKASTLTTDAYVYIERELEAMNGRKAWLALVDHYDGDGEREKRTSKAQADLKALHYRGNELVFPFETFSTKFLKALNVLNKSQNHIIAPGAQVDMLMQKMSGVSNTAIQASMELVASKYKDNVSDCINELSTTIAKRLRDQVHLRDRKGETKRRKISEVGRRNDRSGGRGRGRQGRNFGGRGGGRGGGRDGRGNSGKMEINGVDVSDPTRTFSPDEMTQLGKVGRDYIFAKRQSKNQGPGNGPRQARNASETSTTERAQDTSDEQANGRREKGAKNGARFGNRN